MLIVYYRMEELGSLHYGNFSILGEQAREFTWRTSCSNWVADWTLRGQLFLNEIRREHLGWSTIHKQEWGLFLLEHMLHNAASMRRKEHQRHSQALQASKVAAPEHLFVWTLLGSMDSEILKVAEQVYRGACNYIQHTPPQTTRQMHEGPVPRTHQAYGLAGLQGKPSWIGPLQEAGDAPTAVLLHGPVQLQLGLVGWIWPNDQEKTPW